MEHADQEAFRQWVLRAVGHTGRGTQGPWGMRAMGRTGRGACRPWGKGVFNK